MTSVTLKVTSAVSHTSRNTACIKCSVYMYMGKCMRLMMSTVNNNNNNNNRDDVYGAVIMAKPLQEFTRFI